MRVAGVVGGQYLKSNQSYLSLLLPIGIHACGESAKEMFIVYCMTLRSLLTILKIMSILSAVSFRVFS